MHIPRLNRSNQAHDLSLYLLEEVMRRNFVKAPTRKLQGESFLFLGFFFRSTNARYPDKKGGITNENH